APSPISTGKWSAWATSTATAAPTCCGATCRAAPTPFGVPATRRRRKPSWASATTPGRSSAWATSTTTAPRTSSGAMPAPAPTRSGARATTPRSSACRRRRPRGRWRRSATSMPTASPTWRGATCRRDRTRSGSARTVRCRWRWRRSAASRGRSCPTKTNRESALAAVQPFQRVGPLEERAEHVALLLRELPHLRVVVRRRAEIGDARAAGERGVLERAPERRFARRTARVGRGPCRGEIDQHLLHPAILQALLCRLDRAGALGVGEFADVTHLEEEGIVGQSQAG